MRSVAACGRLLPVSFPQPEGWEEASMARVAVITDSASDLDPAEAAEAGVIVVPLIVTFGPDSYRAGVEMSTEAFWERMTAPDAPFPTTAASSPGDFRTRTRRRLPTAPRPSSRSTSPARCRARSRAPRSRARCSGSRDPHRRLAGRVEGAGDPRADGRGHGGGRHRPSRDRRLPLAPRVGPADVRRARDARIPQARRTDQRRGPRSGRCSRSSRSSPSRRAWSTPRTASGRVPRPASV